MLLLTIRYHTTPKTNTFSRLGGLHSSKLSRYDYLLTFVLGLSLAYSAPTEQDSTDSNEELVNAIKTAFEKKCQKLGGQEAANRLTVRRVIL